VAISRRILGIRFASVPIGLALLASSCTGGSAPKPTPSSSVSALKRGGTLRVGVINQGCWFPFCGTENFDPQMDGYIPELFEVFRCCLIRTLLSFNGRPTANGGALPQPDLAAALPTVSGDGLTWTLRLKKGIHYAPPLASTTVVAQDFVRAIERLVSPRPKFIPDPWGPILGQYSGGFLDLIDIIAGARDYADGKVSAVSGLETPNDLTLVVHLTRPTGDLPYRLAQPDFGPIPASPSNLSAPLGMAMGMARFWGSFVVATGPYMVEGAEKLDPSKPFDPRFPPAGDRPDSFTLVRNPSWNPRTDPLRPALPDRIVLSRVRDEGVAGQFMAAGALDVVLGWDPGPNFAASGPSRVVTTTADAIKFVDMNLAMSPLDDLHVRRAIDYAVARQPFVSIFERAGVGAAVLTHLGLDAEENNLLLNFDPYDAAVGDEAKGRLEMAQSKYDANHDGLCDASACKGVRLLVQSDRPGEPEIARSMARDLRAIGIALTVVPQDRDTFNSTYGVPEAHVAMRIGSWFKDLTSAATWFPPLFGSPATGVTQGFGNPLLGATPDKLKKWGYRVRSVPSVDNRIEACLPLTFNAQLRCWAELDQYLMTEVVPWIPLVSLTTSRVVASRVGPLSFDQAPSTPQPSLDRIQLSGSPSSPSPPAAASPFPSIPDGIYRFTITRADLYRFDPKYDPEGVDENTGEVTVLIRDGQWRSIQIADHPVFHPVNMGVYRGTGDRVVFEVLAFSDNAITTPEMRWTFDGTALRFKFLGCGNLNKLDPEAPHLCDDIRVSYEAHPWMKIG
jgi:peptide/nickel transport system substrate-binding protein